MSRYDLPRPALGILEGTPPLAKQAAKDNNKLHCQEIIPRHGHGSLWTKNLVSRRGLYCLKN